MNAIAYMHAAAAASPVREIMAANNFTAEHTGGGCLAWQRRVDDTGWYITICDEGNGLGDTADEPFMVGLYHADGDFIDCEGMKPIADCIAWGEAQGARKLVLAEIAANDGALLYWQSKDIATAKAMMDSGEIRSVSDLMIHPDAVEIVSGECYRMTPKPEAAPVDIATASKPHRATSYRNEFPDFPAADFPAELPPGFVDTSWGNDVCPSIGNDETNMHVFIDYSDKALREFPDSLRYTVTRFNPETDMNQTDLLSTDNWAEVVACILANKWVARIGGGFHPDTRGADYSPPFDAATVAEYDTDMDKLFAAAGDPYEHGLKAMEAAGLIPPRPVETAPAAPVTAPMDASRKARAIAYTVVALWADTEWHNTERLERECDDALRFAFESARGLDLTQAGEVGKPLAYFAAAFLDDTNPDDLTFCQMVRAIAAAL